MLKEGVERFKEVGMLEQVLLYEGRKFIKWI